MVQLVVGVDHQPPDAVPGGRVGGWAGGGWRREVRFVSVYIQVGVYRVVPALRAALREGAVSEGERGQARLWSSPRPTCPAAPGPAVALAGARTTSPGGLPPPLKPFSEPPSCPGTEPLHAHL